MTDEPTHDYQASQGYPAEADAGHPQPWAEHPVPEEAPTPAEDTPPPARGPRLWPRIAGVALLLVVVAGVWIWLNPGFVQSTLQAWLPGSAANAGQSAAIQALDARVAQLEQRPPVDLTALTHRVDALEARLAAAEARPAAAASDTTAPSPGGTDLAALSDRVDALARQQAQQAANTAKIASLAAQVSALSANQPSDISGKLDDVEQQVGKLAAASDRAVRLEQVEIALAAGRPLGPIPNAPPALARFATAAPPTEAGLRLAFDKAAPEAMKVSAPDTEGKPFFDRILARLQDFRLLTVREGDHVVIGNSTAAALARARVLLDVGDLNGATQAVASLSGPPAEKMAPWLADATALQSAREALAALAANG